jgi:hypothetical protein
MRTMPFGKHKGLPFCDIPTSYLEWLLSGCDSIDSRLRRAVESELDDRTLYGDAHAPDARGETCLQLAVPSKYQPLIAEIIQRGYRAASLKHHPDQGGSATEFRELHTAYEWLRERVAC